MSRFLVLAGVSGTGKTVLLEKLINKYEAFFYKVPQVTTRARRENEAEDTYIFLTKDEYDEVEKDLVGKTCINGNYYGSIPNPNDHRIGVIILNESGFVDFKKSVRFKSEYFSIGLNKPIDTITARREGRDESYLQSEKNVLEMCDTVFNLNDGFINVDLVNSLTLSYFMNYENRINIISTDVECLLSVHEDNNTYTKKIYDGMEEVEMEEDINLNPNLQYICNTLVDVLSAVNKDKLQQDKAFLN